MNRMHLPWQVDRERLREAPFPEAWREYLERNVPHYTFLSELEQEVLQGDLRVFIAEKHWEGCGGLTLTDEIQVTIAAQACLLTLCLPNNLYPNVRTILVYPATYVAPERTVGPAGIVTEGESVRLGEAWHEGPVILSWSDVVSGGRDSRDGHNVVFHEFAHKLDLMDGEADGYPRLHEDGDYPRWQAAMNEEWADLARQSERGRASVLDPYGATNAAELFAVATETFFEKPRQLHQHHPALYQVLKEYYRQDPLARLDAF
jgi:Mlc titration factor MtfA (ptsG expression regulator)